MLERSKSCAQEVHTVRWDQRDQHSVVLTLFVTLVLLVQSRKVSQLRIVSQASTLMLTDASHVSLAMSVISTLAKNIQLTP